MTDEFDHLLLERRLKHRRRIAAAVAAALTGVLLFCIDLWSTATRGHTELTQTYYFWYALTPLLMALLIGAVVVLFPGRSWFQFLLSYSLSLVAPPSNAKRELHELARRQRDRVREQSRATQAALNNLRTSWGQWRHEPSTGQIRFSDADSQKRFDELAKIVAQREAESAQGEATLAARLSSEGS